MLNQLMSTWEARFANLSMLMKEMWNYDVPFPSSWGIGTHIMKIDSLTGWLVASLNSYTNRSFTVFP